MVWPWLGMCMSVGSNLGENSIISFCQIFLLHECERARNLATKGEVT